MTDRDDDPPLRLILIWDNLAGHKSTEIVRWLCAPGMLPLDTPLSGAWLNRAESLQRIIVRRALAGQHPQTPEEIIAWLAETVAGWNTEPTPFLWEGKRWERRNRARHRLLGGSAAIAQCQSIAALGRSQTPQAPDAGTAGASPSARRVPRRPTPHPVPPRCGCSTAHGSPCPASPPVSPAAGRRVDASGRAPVSHRGGGPHPTAKSIPPHRRALSVRRRQSRPGRQSPP